MIFFGTRGKVVQGQVVEGIQCPSCESKRFITFGIIRYFHLYWIPVFPTSKIVGIECTHCKKTLMDKEIPGDLSRQLKSTLFGKKHIIPMFSGLIIIACLVLSVMFIAQQDNEKMATYFEQPAINDLYIVNFDEIFINVDPQYKYGLMRIKNISKDQVEFQVSKVAFNRDYGVRRDIRNRKAYSDGYYEDDYLSIHLSELRRIKDSNGIFSIERN